MLKKKKKSEHQDDWGGFENHLQPLMRTPEMIEKELIQGGYLDKTGFLSMEREMDYLQDKEVIRMKKRNPAGQNKTFRDLNVTVCKDQSTTFERMEKEIARWRDRKGFIDQQKTRQLMNMTEKYRPGFLAPKPEEPKKEPVTPPPSNPIAIPTKDDTVKPLPKRVDLNDIKI